MSAFNNQWWSRRGVVDNVSDYDIIVIKFET